MNNLFFDNNIKVSISKSPENPIEGDDVVFVASVNMNQRTTNYSNNSTYFFSYTWMESQDGGASYYKVGQDLENLTISNISKNFFNNLYKVQVALIDLENIILTEDGDNLTTQFGEILIGNNPSSNMAIQSTNNSTLSDAPAIDANIDVTALDISNLNTIIDEAIVYDTTLNDENKAIVSGGQITIDKVNNSQILNGIVPQQISLENLPDPEFVIPTSSQNTGIQATKFLKETISNEVGCDTKLSYDLCKSVDNSLVNGSMLNEYNSLEECLSAKGCTTDGIIDIYLANLDDPDAPYSLGKPLGFLANTVIEDLPTTGLMGTFYRVGPTRAFCCPGTVNQVCPEELKTGESNCDSGGAYVPSATFPPNGNRNICAENFRRYKRKVVTIVPEGYDPAKDCGCSTYNTMDLDLIAYDDNGKKSFTSTTFSDDEDVTGMQNFFGAESEVATVIFEAVGATTEVTLAPSQVAAGQALKKYIVSAVVKQVAQKLAIGVIAGVGFKLVLLGTVVYVGGSIIWQAVFMKDNGDDTSKPVEFVPAKQIQCTDTIFKQIHKCDTDTDPYNYLGPVENPKTTRQDVSSYSPTATYECLCDKGSGSINIVKYTKEQLPEALLSSWDGGCTYYVTKQSAKPCSTCTCTFKDPFVQNPYLPDAPHYILLRNASSIDQTYTFSIPCNKAPEDLFEINKKDYQDCITTKDNCNAKCDGFYCCGHADRWIYMLESDGSESLLCNEEKTITLDDSTSNGSITIKKCNDDSTNTISITIQSITQKLRDCNQKSDNSTSFDSYGAALAQATVNSKDNYGIVKNYITVNDDSNKVQIAGEIKDSDGTILMHPLYKHAKIKYQDYTLINGDKKCDPCKIIYQVDQSNAEYPCNDKDTKYCGINLGNCNVDSTDTTRITIATITKVEPTTPDIIVKAKSGADGYYDDLGKAIVFAKSVANPGIVQSNPPDPSCP